MQRRDRVFWVLLSWIRANWRSALLIVQPDTVVRRHRVGFELFLRWKSRRKPGCPKVDAEIPRLIRLISRENPLWGVPRVKSELALLGHIVAESTVNKCKVSRHKPGEPSLIITYEISSLLISLACRPPRIAFCTVSSCSVATAERSLTSTLQLIRLRGGRLGQSLTPFPTANRYAFSSGIVMLSTALIAARMAFSGITTFSRRLEH